MELEHAMSMAGVVLSRLPRQPVTKLVIGGAVAGSRARQLPPPPSPSLLYAAVQEMLMVQKGTVAKKLRVAPPRLLPGGIGSSSDSCAERRITAEPAVKAAVMPAARTRQALAKRVARRMLRRGATSPSPDHHHERKKKVVLTCCCPRLPPGLRCALHQCGAPGRSWMRGAPVAAAGEAVAPSAHGRGGGWAFSEYARWRRSVWMPSRSYLEHVDQLEDDAAARRSSSTAADERERNACTNPLRVRCTASVWCS